MPDERSKLVYSTDKPVSRKERPVEKNVSPTACPSQQKVIVRLDRKRRGGKSVTVIEGIQIPVEQREVLLKRLKARLGTGGTVKGSLLEIQGDHCVALMAELAHMGYRPKRSGG